MDSSQAKQALQATQVQQAKTGNFQNMYATPGKFKKQLDEVAAAMRSGGQPEREPQSAEISKGAPEMVHEIPTQPELEKKPDLAGYIENVEKAAENIKPVLDDYTNQVLLGSANPQNIKVILPLSEDRIEEGMHHKAWEAIRWLAEWCMRQLKIVKAKDVVDDYDN